jgi:hypothetical protein
MLVLIEQEVCTALNLANNGAHAGIPFDSVNNIRLQMPKIPSETNFKSDFAFIFGMLLIRAWHFLTVSMVSMPEWAIRSRINNESSYIVIRHVVVSLGLIGKITRRCKECYLGPEPAAAI